MPADASEVSKLTEVVEHLAVQVRQLALILDEVREELVWAVRNDKFTCAGASHRYVAERLTEPPPEVQDDDEPDPPPRASSAASQGSLFS
jgi:hypothetical protein